MILPTPELVLAIGAALLSLWCAIAVSAARARLAQAPKEVERALEQCHLECRETVAQALGEFSRMEQNLPPCDPTRDPGRLHRSSRTRALRLLRCGVSPDSAAATLEIPRKEMLLLAQVASVLGQ